MSLLQHKMVPQLLWLIAAISILGFSMFLGEPTYDEPHYLQNTMRFANGELNWWDFGSHRGPTGPGYAWIHAILWNSIPAITFLRVCNALLLLASSVLIAASTERNWTSALVLLIFPGIWVSGAMALTEVFSIFFISLGLFLFQIYNEKSKPTTGLLAMAFALGIASFSRQTLIVVAPAFFLMWGAVHMAGKKAPFQQFLIPLVVACIIPAPMFLAWGGLLPHDDFAHEQITSQGLFKPIHVAYGLAYLTLFIIALDIAHAARWFKQHFKVTLLLGAGSFAVSHFLSFEYLPLRSTINSLVSEEMAYALSLAFPTIALCISAYVICKTTKLRDIRFLQSASQVELFCVAAIILITISNGAITHQFSSRYLTMCAPFVAFLTPRFKVTSLSAILFILISAISLSSYIS